MSTELIFSNATLEISTAMKAQAVMTSWTWRQHGPPKRLHSTPSFHRVITQNTRTWIFS